MKKYIFLFLLILIPCFLTGVCETFAQSVPVEMHENIRGRGGSSTTAVDPTSFTEFFLKWVTDDFSGCWFCGVFSTIFDAVNQLATYSVENLSASFLVILGIGILFFLVFKVGKMFVQFQNVDLMQFMDELLKPLGRAMIAAALLIFSLSIFEIVVNPFLKMSLDLSEAIFTATSKSDFSVVMVQRSNTAGGTNQLNNVTYEKKDFSQTGDSNTKGTALKGEVKAALLYNMRLLSSSLIFGMASGVFFIIKSFSAAFLSFKVFPSIYMLFMGIILLITYSAIYLTFPLKLFDALVRLAFVCALMPLWIVLWVFPATVDYTKKAWGMFLNTCLLFVTLSVSLGFILIILENLLPGDRNTFFNALIKNQAQKALDAIPITSTTLLTTLALGYVCYKMVGMAVSLADTFSESSGDLGVNQTANVILDKATSTGLSKGWGAGYWFGRNTIQAGAGMVKNKYTGTSYGQDKEFTAAARNAMKFDKSSFRYNNVDYAFGEDGIEKSYQKNGQDVVESFESGIKLITTTTHKNKLGNPLEKEVHNASGDLLQVHKHDPMNTKDYTIFDADGKKIGFKKGNILHTQKVVFDPVKKEYTTANVTTITEGNTRTVTSAYLNGEEFLKDVEVGKMDGDRFIVYARDSIDGKGKRSHAEFKYKNGRMVRRETTLDDGTVKYRDYSENGYSDYDFYKKANMPGSSFTWEGETRGRSAGERTYDQYRKFSKWLFK
ncbi:MAG: hypothetical protein LBU87_07110 [Lactobacillales bacterium]|jgi:hypothetical protein|nr:hypothetical protein [Lactobacillales bacterium]